MKKIFSISLIAYLIYVTIPFPAIGKGIDHLFHRSYAEQWLGSEEIRVNLGKNDNIPEMIRILETLEREAVANNDLQLGSILKLTRFRYQMYDEISVLKEINITEVVEFARENNMKYLEADALQFLADYQWKNEDYASSLEHYMLAYQLYHRFSYRDFPHKSECLYEFGGKYYFYTDYKTANSYFLEIWNTIPRASIHNVHTVLNNIGLCYSYQGIFDSSLKYFNLAEQIAVADKHQEWIAIINGNKANIYYERKMYDKALPLLEKDVSLSLGTGALMEAAFSLAVISDIHRRYGNPVLALEKAQQAYSLLQQKDKTGDAVVRKSIYPHIAAAYAANGKNNIAYAFLDTASAAKDSLVNRKNLLMLAGTQYKVEAQQHLEELKAAETQLSHQKIIRNASFSGLGIVLLLLLMVYHNFNLQRKANKLLKESQKQLVESEKMAAYGVMATRVAHEIQNPLNFVNNFSSLASDLVDEILTSDDENDRKEAGETLQVNLGKILHHGQRAETIVRQLLAHVNTGTAYSFFEEEKQQSRD